MFTLIMSAVTAAIVWYLISLTFKQEWETVAREEGFKEGFAQALIEHGVALDEKDNEVAVRTVHPLDEVTEMEAIAVPEHNPTEELPPDPGFTTPLRDDDSAGHE